MQSVKREIKDEPDSDDDFSVLPPKKRSSDALVEVEIKDEPGFAADSSAADPLDLPKKPKLTVLTLSEKQMIYNVAKYIEESEDTKLLSNLYNKVASVLNISTTNVFEVLKEYKETGTLCAQTYVCKPSSTALQNDNLTAIRKRIHRFYLRAEVPTFARVLEDLNSDEPIFQKNDLKKILKHMKFKTVKGSNMRALIEKDEHVLQRIYFLRDMKKFREEGRDIFYLAETYIPVGPPPVAEEKKKKQKVIESGLILAHIGSSEGFVDDCMLLIEPDATKKTEHLTAYQFETWLKDILPKLGPKAVIVLSNDKHHRRLTERLPSLFWLKKDIQKWLDSKSIEYEQDEFKVELVERVKKVKDQYKTYAIDAMAKEYDVEIRRLPPYHLELNALEMILAEIKQDVAKSATVEKIEKIKEILGLKIQIVTVNTWKEQTSNVMKEEEVLLKLDYAIDDVIDNQVLDDKVQDTESQAGYHSDSSSSCSEDDEILGF